MLHDRARIHVQAGAGGDGGRGGDVVFVCEDSLRDLQGFRRRTQYRAGRGGHGEGALRHGADGEVLRIGVPPGTQIVASDDDEGDLAGRRWELLAGGQRAKVARGGGGGKGNKRFATPTRQAPRFAERGLPGEEGWLELRLKLLADVGLVGLP
ncbi:MAG TPA: GTPase ObgE, partial [Patescibacteria group bacterium]|nr:GTPase ObgE [Patescibacteria group bacterium]